jgi:hypothetical protein
MNLSKRVKRTCPETIDDTRAFREAVKRIDRGRCVPDGKSMRRPSRNCPSIICAQAPSRPEGRACAVGAKRRALHGAEHRCSIVVVMADGVAPASDVLTSRRPQVDIEYDPREAQLRGQQLAGKHAPNLP